MWKGLIATLVISAVAAATPRLSAQANGQVMSGLTLQPRPAPAPKPYTFRIPSLDAAKKANELRAELAKRLEAETARQRGSSTPTVVCGMMVVKVDPSFDASIRKAPPTDVTFTMKRIQPTACTPSEP